MPLLVATIRFTYSAAHGTVGCRRCTLCDAVSGKTTMQSVCLECAVRPAVVSEQTPTGSGVSVQGVAFGVCQRTAGGVPRFVDVLGGTDPHALHHVARHAWSARSLAAWDEHPCHTFESACGDV